MVPISTGAEIATSNRVAGLADVHETFAYVVVADVSYCLAASVSDCRCVLLRCCAIGGVTTTVVSLLFDFALL